MLDILIKERQKNQSINLLAYVWQIRLHFTYLRIPLKSFLNYYVHKITII